MQVVTISRWLNFGGPAPPGRGLRLGGGEFDSALLQSSRTLCVYGGTSAGAQCLRLSERFFIISIIIIKTIFHKTTPDLQDQDLFLVSDRGLVLKTDGLGPHHRCYIMLCWCCCSYLGACQLELDVLYVRTWLESYVIDPGLRPAVISHEGLAYMDAVVSLLKQQPPVLTGRKATPPANQRKPSKNHNQRRQLLFLRISLPPARVANDERLKLFFRLAINQSFGGFWRWQL